MELLLSEHWWNWRPIAGVRRQLTRRWRPLLLVASLLLMLLLHLWPARGRQNQDAIARVWHNVQQAGSYEFKADVTQHTIPVASVRNIGRASQRQDLSRARLTCGTKPFI